MMKGSNGYDAMALPKASFFSPRRRIKLSKILSPSSTMREAFLAHELFNLPRLAVRYRIRYISDVVGATKLRSNLA